MRPPFRPRAYALYATCGKCSWAIGEPPQYNPYEHHKRVLSAARRHANTTKHAVRVAIERIYIPRPSA